MDKEEKLQTVAKIVLILLISAVSKGMKDLAAACAVSSQKNG